MHRGKLTDLLLRLPIKHFIRVHRSYIVNEKFINKISINNLILDRIDIPVSKTYRKEILKFI